MTTHSSDVVIVGASQAGSCLARHLILRHSGLKITVLERKKEFDYGVGESMLETFFNYASKELQLTKYLDDNFYYKHGLRFFFEKEPGKSSLADMSELGRTWYTQVPAHQVNRRTFDTDLAQMNRQSGVDVRMGVAVLDVELDGQGGHRVKASDGTLYHCRYLVDASGFGGVLGRKLKDVRKIDSHPNSTAWMRVRHIRDINTLGDQAWRENAQYTSRALATNHFVYQGHWVWMIPIDVDTYSIGVVWRHDRTDLDINSQSELEDFFLSHQWGRELFGDRYEVLDFKTLKNMSRISDTLFSGDRWFRTGIAAGFIDPLYSSGSAWLTELNRMIVDLIETDLAGQAGALRHKAAAYDIYAHWWFQNFFVHVNGGYHGSYDQMTLVFKAILLDFYGIIFPASVTEYWRTFADLKPEQLADLKQTLDARIREGGATFAHRIRHELHDVLGELGDPFVGNQGQYFDVNLPEADMMYSLTRGKGFDAAMIEEVRSNIEAQILCDAVKIVRREQGARLDPDDAARLGREVRAGRVRSLREALQTVREADKVALS